MIEDQQSFLMLPIERLYKTIERQPERVAIAGETTVTYRMLGRAVDAVAVELQRLDHTAGSRVGICAKNTVEHLIAMLATYRAGKVWVPLNPRNGIAELDAMINTTRPTIMVVDESCMNRFTRTDAWLILAKTNAMSAQLPTAAAGNPMPITATGDNTSIQAIMRANDGQSPIPVTRGAEDAQILKFSGGSTGAPKAIVQPVRCINAQADGILDFFEFDGDDVNLIAAPLTHGASCFVLPILEAGGRHVLLEDANPTAILGTIERQGVTTIYAPPTMLYGMLGAVREGQRFPSLRHVIYSAAPMSAKRIRECQGVFGNAIETAYGQVEAPQIVTAMRAHELLIEANLESVGRPSSVAEVRIDGGSGTFATAGDVGEIIVRGELLMGCYLDQPELTAGTIIDGWLHTGDTGTIDERGYLFIRGRLKELINTGGFKVYPGEVEAVLSRHSAVAECAAFGIEDEKWGEAVTAAVVRTSGTMVSEAELIAFVKQELGSVKAPKSIRFLPELPRNAAGKVSRADLKRSIQGFL